MKTIRLSINGEELDFIDVRSVPVKIYKQIADVNDPTTKSGDYTLTIRLPRTPRNERFFIGFHELETLDKFRIIKPFSARLEVNSAEAIAGEFILKRTTAKTYEGVIYATNIAIFRGFGDKTLRDLTFDKVPFNGRADMVATWGKDWKESPIQFPLVAYGPFFNPNLPSPDLLQSGIFFDPNSKPSVSGIATGINFDDIQPATYYAAIVRQMFKESGWSVGGWFQNQGNKLLLPYVGKSGPVWPWGTVGIVNANSSTFQEFDDDTQAMGDENYDDVFYADNDQPTSIPFMGIWDIEQDTKTDPGLLFDLDTAEYRVPADGNYSFRVGIGAIAQFRRWDIYFEDPGYPTAYNPRRTLLCALRIPNSSYEKEALYENLFDYLLPIPAAAPSVLTDPNILLAYELNSNELSRGPWFINNSGNLATGTVHSDSINSQIQFPTAWGVDIVVSGGGCDVSTGGRFLYKGDRVKFVLVQPTTIYNGLAKNLYFVTFSIFNSFFQVTNDLETDLCVEQNLPAIKQRAFLEDMITRANLYWTINANRRTIYFQPIDEYFRDNAFAVEWTEKTNDRAGTIKPIKQYTEIFFAWKKDSKDYHYDDTAAEEDDYTRENPSIFASGSKSLTSKIFAATMDRRFHNFSEGTTVDQQKPMFIPMIADEERATQNRSAANWKFDYMPRILIWRGLVDCPKWEFHNDPTLLTQYPAAYFNADRIGISADLSLSFNGESGLFLLFWREQIEEAERSHVLEIFPLLTEFDVAALDPSIPIRINGQFYKLNKLDGFNPTIDAPTRVELVRRLRN